MRIAILVTLGLVLAAGLAIGAQVIARDSAPRPPSDRGAVTRAQPSHRAPTVPNTAPGGGTRPRLQVTAPVDHRGRQGIEEAEVDSHGAGSGRDG